MAVPALADVEAGAMMAATTSDIARDWDAIVVGAGPAGGIAARELARRGVEVLLVDKAAFPRFKVCGCCLNRGAMETLGRLGLGGVPRSLGATPLEAVTFVSHRGRRATVPLVGGCAVSRERLDAALVHAAIESGAQFVPECAATVGEVEGTCRVVQLRGMTARAGIVIAADGLAGTSLSRLDGFAPRIAARSRIGIGAVIERPAVGFAKGAITMVCGHHGYLGAVWIEENRLDIAAAVDPVWLKAVGGPRAGIADLLGEAGIEAELSCVWRGTPALTRRRSVEADRLMVIGDAAGYVEPFTGEGMAWAMAGAEAAAEFACARWRGGVGASCREGFVRGDAPCVALSGLKHRGGFPGAYAPGKVLSPLRGWGGEREQDRASRLVGTSWADVHRRLVGRGQRECRWIARMLRHPLMIDAAIRVLGVVPSLASPIVHRINHGRGRGAASEAIA